MEPAETKSEIKTSALRTQTWMMNSLSAWPSNRARRVTTAAVGSNDIFGEDKSENVEKTQFRYFQESQQRPKLRFIHSVV